MNLTLSRKFTCLHCSHCCYFDSVDRAPLLFEDEVEKILKLGMVRGFELSVREEFEIDGVKFFRLLISNLTNLL